MADLCPDPSVAKRKLNLNLCKKGKGRADQERSESFTFIDDVKVVSLKKIVPTNKDSSTKWVLDLGTWSLSNLALHDTQTVITELHAHYNNVRVISIMPGLTQLHLFSDRYLQYYIIIIITPPATEAYIY